MKFLTLALFVCVGTLCAALPSAQAEEILGKVKVWINGDTCIFEPATGGEDIRVRLWPIDAPERDQPMGEDALRYMKHHPEVGEGKKVYLYKVSKDRYKRTIGQLCGEHSKQYCSADLLLSGYFWLYEPALRGLTAKEQEAWRDVFKKTQDAKKGIFKYESSVNPQDWRKMGKEAKQKAREAWEVEKRTKG